MFKQWRAPFTASARPPSVVYPCMFMCVYKEDARPGDAFPPTVTTLWEDPRVGAATPGRESSFSRPSGGPRSIQVRIHAPSKNPRVKKFGLPLSGGRSPLKTRSRLGSSRGRSRLSARRMRMAREPWLGGSARPRGAPRGHSRCGPGAVGPREGWDPGPSRGPHPPPSRPPPPWPATRRRRAPRRMERRRGGGACCA